MRTWMWQKGTLKGQQADYMWKQYWPLHLVKHRPRHKVKHGKWEHIPANRWPQCISHAENLWSGWCSSVDRMALYLQAGLHRYHRSQSSRYLQSLLHQEERWQRRLPSAMCFILLFLSPSNHIFFFLINGHFFLLGSNSKWEIFWCDNSVERKWSFTAVSSCRTKGMCPQTILLPASWFSLPGGHREHLLSHVCPYRFRIYSCGRI